MATYEDGRSLLPKEQQFRIQSVASEDVVHHENIPDSGETVGEHLLSDYQHNGNRAIGRATSRTRQSGWLCINLFAVAVVASTLALAGLMLSLNPLRPNDGPQAGTDHLPPSHPHRPDDRYILSPAWDFSAQSQVREYEWTITDGEGRPDGVHRPMMLINDQFPGPLIEINEGDVVTVNVLNKASNSTAIHWHGIFQNGTNWMDGAAGVTQCPIAPGQSYQYRFNVTGQSGTCKQPVPVFRGI
jgi:hypothetical protein